MIEEDKVEFYVCSICSVICDSFVIFEFYFNGCKYVVMVEKYVEVS